MLRKTGRQRPRLQGCGGFAMFTMFSFYDMILIIQSLRSQQRMGIYLHFIDGKIESKRVVYRD